MAASQGRGGGLLALTSGVFCGGLEGVELSTGDSGEVAQRVSQGGCRSIQEPQRRVCMNVEFCERMPGGKYEQELNDRSVVWLREQAFDAGNDTLDYGVSTVTSTLIGLHT